MPSPLDRPAIQGVDAADIEKVIERPSDDKVNLQIARRVEEVVNLVHSEGSVLRSGFQDHE
jgi:hypothetical protein